MENFQFIGKMLILFGLILFVLGVIFYFFEKIPFIGKLPGDIYIKKENFVFYFPVVTSIILSIILTLILYIFRKKM
ncbi:MAG: DUF2905 domain-containing protein [Ignavibacteria bacterium]|nr:DUF2905 domain-containing protein [Ignavibacteria bacterium]